MSRHQKGRIRMTKIKGTAGKTGAKQSKGTSGLINRRQGLAVGAAQAGPRSSLPSHTSRGPAQPASR